MNFEVNARKLLCCTPAPEIMFRSKAAGAVTVVAYHRINPAAAHNYPFDEELFSATPEQFSRELRYFRRNLDILTMSELAAGMRNPETLPARPAVVTFDDGYADNHDIAMPLLKEQGISACFFLCTRIVGTADIPWYDAFVCCLKHSNRSSLPSPFGADDPPYVLDKRSLAESIRRYRRNLRLIDWSDMESHLRDLSEATGVNPADYLDRPLFMSWDAAQAMVTAGMELGGHTRRHPILSRVTDPLVLREEIAGCWSDLGERLGRPPLSFAFPIGGWDAWSHEAEQEVIRAGFDISFSYINSLTPRAPGSRHFLPRVHCEFGRNHRAFRLAMARVPRFGEPASHPQAIPAPQPA